MKSRKHLTAAEVDGLLEAASSSRWACRDQAMIAFCFQHGLRASELVALRWAHIDWIGKNVIILRRKQRTSTGTRPNVHPLGQDEMKALKKLWAEYGAESDFVFATERHGCAQRLGLDGEPIEAEHVARFIDAAKFNRSHSIQLQPPAQWRASVRIPVSSLNQGHARGLRSTAPTLEPRALCQHSARLKG